MKQVHVAVGVVCDAQNRILIAQRPQHVHQGGLWEFPGGKIEPGESVEQALARELAEELAIEIGVGQPLLQVEHDYGDKAVLLDVWWVREFTGEPHGREGQLWRWASVTELALLPFPAANQPIIAAIAQRFHARGGSSPDSTSS
jgi:8-oxo-dGTP diphosphatase